MRNVLGVAGAQTEDSGLACRICRDEVVVSNRVLLNDSDLLLLTTVPLLECLGE